MTLQPTIDATNRFARDHQVLGPATIKNFRFIYRELRISRLFTVIDETGDNHGRC